MRILLTNDDGIDAPGLRVLESIAKEISSDLWIVAPRVEQSGKARSFSFGSPLRLYERDPRRFSVEGTPVDCVMLAVHHLMRGKRPDLILSGVNRGQNIAEDVTYSGTVSAAAEGAILGIPSIALSQAFGLDGTSLSLHWETAEAHAPSLIKRLIKRSWPSDIVLSVNFPHRAPSDVEGTRITRQGKREQPFFHVEERIDPRGQSYYWFGFKRKQGQTEEGTDLHAIYGGYISITPLHFDLTHNPTRDALAETREALAAPAKP